MFIVIISDIISVNLTLIIIVIIIVLKTTSLSVLQTTHHILLSPKFTTI